MESPGWANQASSYGAEQSRRAVFAWAARTAANVDGILAGGLLSASDLQLSAPGSGLSVNISVGSAVIGGSEGGVQGGYYARNASVTNLAISTANPTNPRIDTIALTIADSGYTEPTGVSGNAAVLQVVVGTATAGATLSNLNGKAALPASSLLLGYVLVPNAASNIITADIANVATICRLGFGALSNPVMSQPSRSLATVYQPNISRATLVVAAVEYTQGAPGQTGVVNLLAGPTNPPTSTIGQYSYTTSATSLTTFGQLVGLVLPGQFYEFTSSATGAIVALNAVTEYTL